MGRLLTSPWSVALIGGFLYLLTTAALVRPKQFERPAPEPADSALAVKPGPSWLFKNPEFDQWVEELKQEKEALAQRARQLEALQKRLDAERQEILTVTQTVYQLQADFDKNVIRIKAQEAENLKHQLKVVSGMSPEGAAAMLTQMPEEQTVALLFMMKPDTSSLILDTLSKMGKTEAKLAAELAEKMRVVLPPSPPAARPASN